jgi:hypothetical protein
MIFLLSLLAVTTFGSLTAEEALADNLETQVAGPDPALANAPWQRRYAMNGNWQGSTLFIPTTVGGVCEPDGTWVQTNYKGYHAQRLYGAYHREDQWTPLHAKTVCGGVFPLSFVMSRAGTKDPSRVTLCCPKYPFTKKAKPCTDYGCTKFAKEWKKDGLCDLENCGNCPAMWDKNVFDGGACGDVAYAAVDTDAESEVASSVAVTTSSSTGNSAVYLLAAFGLAVTIYGSFRFYVK